MNMGGMLKLAFLMAVRFLPRTLLLLGGTIGLCLIWFYYLPMPAVFLCRDYGVMPVPFS